MYSRIKLSARCCLNNSYFKILPLLTLMIFAVFIFSLCNSAANIFFDEYIFILFPVLSLLVFVLITSPVRFSMETKYFMLARGIRNAKTITGFSGLKKSLLFYPAIFLIKTFWLTVFEAIPVSSAIILYFYLRNNSLSMKAAVTFLACVVILAIVGMVFYSVFIQRYSKAAFYLVCYEGFSVLDALKESKRKTQNSLCEILLFKLSFLPWFMLCIGIVPILFVIPYYKQSLILYCLK